jgi:hypothetical protein
MKKTLMEDCLPVGVRRHTATPWENELNSRLDQIHARYSGSLKAFFEDLDRKSGKFVNGKRRERGRRLASAE